MSHPASIHFSITLVATRIPSKHVSLCHPSIPGPLVFFCLTQRKTPYPYHDPHSLLSPGFLTLPWSLLCPTYPISSFYSRSATHPPSRTNFQAHQGSSGITPFVYWWYLLLGMVLPRRLCGLSPLLLVSSQMRATSSKNAAPPRSIFP